MTIDDLPLTSTQKVKHHVVRENLIDGKYPNKKWPILLLYRSGPFCHVKNRV